MHRLFKEATLNTLERKLLIMKKLALILLCFAMSVSLVACTNSNNNDMTDSANNSTVSSENRDTGITDNNSSGNNNSSNDTAENGEELKDGKYTAEANDYGEDGYKPFVELTVSNGKISEIDLDAVNKNGEYKKDSDNTDWIDKIGLFEKEMVAKGIADIEFNSDGTVNGIEGFDINIGEYTDLINEAVAKARKNS